MTTGPRWSAGGTEQQLPYAARCAGPLAYSHHLGGSGTAAHVLAPHVAAPGELPPPAAHHARHTRPARTAAPILRGFRRRVSLRGHGVACAVHGLDLPRPLVVQGAPAAVRRSRARVPRVASAASAEPQQRQPAAPRAELPRVYARPAVTQPVRLLAGHRGAGRGFRQLTGRASAAAAERRAGMPLAGAQAHFAGAQVDKGTEHAGKCHVRTSSTHVSLLRS